METQDGQRYRRRIKQQNIGLIILGAVIILALLAMVVFMVRLGRINKEHQLLQDEQTSLLNDNHHQTSELMRRDSLLAQKRNDIQELIAANEEQQRALNNQAAGLRRRSVENEELVKQLQAYRLMEEEFEKMQAQYAHLLGEYENLDQRFDRLELKHQLLKDSVDQSKGLKALNIRTLSKWERWLWADRYNVSRARRVDETLITFELWGSMFTQLGERTVYLSMVDPSGMVMYPTPADPSTDDTDNGIPFTKKQEVDFSGDPIPLAFTIRHPEGLTPGIYMVMVYVDAVLVGSEQLVFE